MKMRENVNPDINEQLAKMIIQLMFKKDKSNEPGETEGKAKTHYSTCIF